MINKQNPLSVVIFENNNRLVNFRFDEEKQEIWASIKDIADLYEVDRETVSYHVKSIYSDGELDENSTTQEFQVVQNEGNRSVSRTLSFYNLDVIISVGYRVNAKKAIAFRQWATKTLRAYLEQGYVINEKVLRDSPEKVNELAAKIRAIRSDEKQVYAKVRECFKISASDYDPSSQEVRTFYALLQDKLHHAVTQTTSAKLIMDRANHREENMGLYSYKGTHPTKSDVTIGKNYLTQKELYRLHLLSEQFLLYAESTALGDKKMTMSSLIAQLDKLLAVNDYPIFSGWEDFIRDIANDHALQELELFNKRKKIESLGYEYDEDTMISGEYNHLLH